MKAKIKKYPYNITIQTNLILLVFIITLLLNTLIVLAKDDILTLDERNFLKELGEIQMIVDDDYAPISYFDTQTNQYGGIAVEAMKQLAQTLDFNFTIIRDKSLTWSDKLDMIKNSQAHVLGGASVNEDRLEYGYFTDETYFQVNYAIIGSVDNHIIIRQLTDIGKYRIGLIKNTGINKLILDNILPDTQVLYFDTMDHALVSLKDHEIDLITDNEAVFIEEYFNDQRFDYEILYSVNDMVKNYTFFTPKTEEGLKLSKILNKGMKEINMDLIVSERYQNKSIFTYYREYTEKLRRENEVRSFFLIILIFIVVLVLTVIMVIKLKNNELEALAKTDHLTQLKNRNSLFADYSKRDSLNKKKVYFIDLDNFKFINDSYGHDAGDQVLKGVAKRLRAFAPKANIYRMGGDEFLLITETTQEDFGTKLLEIIQVPIIYEQKECKVDGSIGYLETDNFPNAALHEIINLADYAMLEAKASGKNNILEINADMIERFKDLLGKKI